MANEYVSTINQCHAFIADSTAELHILLNISFSSRIDPDPALSHIPPGMRISRGDDASPNFGICDTTLRTTSHRVKFKIH